MQATMQYFDFDEEYVIHIVELGSNPEDPTWDEFFMFIGGGAI